MRPDENIHLPALRGEARLKPLRGRTKAREHIDFNGERRHPLAEGRVVLLGEHGGRREECDLLMIDRSDERRPHGNLGLTIPSVPAKQAIHRRRRRHIRLNLRDRPRLIRRLLPRE